MLEGGEIGWRVLGADAAFVVAENHIHHPVQAVLDCPVAADDRSHLVRQPHQGGDVEAGFPLDLVGLWASTAGVGEPAQVDLRPRA